MSSISVIIGIFGDEKWKVQAANAALSAFDQTLQAKEIIVEYQDTLAEARNKGAARATGEWLLFLDADDELDENYIKAMSNKIEELDTNRVLLQPATLGIVDGREDPFPVIIPPKADILDGNWMVIGTLVAKEIFDKVGGFQEFPAYEDWDLWIRCMIKGKCKYYPVPDAIYRVNVDPNSRNNQDQKVLSSTYRKIRRQYKR